MSKRAKYCDSFDICENVCNVKELRPISCRAFFRSIIYQKMEESLILLGGGIFIFIFILILFIYFTVQSVELKESILFIFFL